MFLDQISFSLIKAGRGGPVECRRALGGCDATRHDATRRDADVQSEIFHKEPFHRAHLLEVRASSERAFRTVCFTCRTVVRVVECTDYYAEANIYLYSFQLNRQRVRYHLEYKNKFIKQHSCDAWPKSI